MKQNFTIAATMLLGVGASFLPICQPPSVLAQEPQVVIDRAPSRPITMELQAVPTGQVVTMLMRDIVRVPYVIAPEVLADRAPVSVKLVIPRDNIPITVKRYLETMGFKIEVVGGTAFVSKSSFSKGSRENEQPASFAQVIERNQAPSSPLVEGSPAALPGRPNHPAPGPAFSAGPRHSAIAIVRPAHRDPAELATLLETALPSVSIVLREQVAARGGEILDQVVPDTLVLAGDSADLAFARVILQELDRPRQLVAIRAMVFEVRETKDRSSAFAALVDLFGGKVSVSSGSPLAADDFIRFASGGVSAIFSAVRSDGRFEVVAEPSLAALSGSTARLVSGSEVPTLGAVSFQEDGSPIRSVVYRQSGVTLEITPVVRGGEIELDVLQERSSFARTTTGVDDSPTLNNSSAKAKLSLQPGEAVLIAGLQETSKQDGRSGFLGGLLSSMTRQNASAQLMVMIQAELMPQASQGETGFILVEPPTLEEPA